MMRMAISALGLLMLCGTSLPDPQADFANRLVATHNAERARVGTKPLAWSDSLAKDAAIWAAEMARTDSFEHAKQSGQGENLWMGTKSSFRAEEMVEAWIDEKSMYKPGRFPDVTTTDNWADVGHYTQLIWGNTTHVGCALASSKTDDYLVCRYGPPGNWVGQDPIRPIAK